MGVARRNAVTHHPTAHACMQGTRKGSNCAGIEEFLGLFPSNVSRLGESGPRETKWVRDRETARVLWLVLYPWRAPSPVPQPQLQALHVTRIYTNLVITNWRATSPIEPETKIPTAEQFIWASHEMPSTLNILFGRSPHAAISSDAMFKSGIMHNIAHIRV